MQVHRLTGRCMLHKGVFFAFLISLLITRPDPAFAQARDTASLFGTVTDAQSAVVTGARLTLTNTATGLSRSAMTDNNGGFVFPLLPVGSYNLSAAQPGFRKYERLNILLRSIENVGAQVPLDIGNVQWADTVAQSPAP